MEKQSTSRLLKLVVSAFALFLLLTCGVLLSACGGEEHVHAYEKTDSKAIATCGATGYDVYTCSCGDQYAIVTAATGKHTFTNGRCTVCGIPDTFDATALQAKLDEINRTVDGQHKSISDSLDGIDSALDELHIHKFEAVEDATVDPTCMAGGFTYAVCECGSSSVTKITQALGHDWKDDDTLTQAATCTSAGMTYQRCSRCGETKEKAAIAPVEHEWVEDETRTIPATCTTAGQKIEKCANCDATRAGAAIEALGHTWKMNGEGEEAVEGTVVAPTCTVGGYTRHECTVCGFSYDDTFTAATEHTWVEDPSREMAPTCTGYGQKWERCSVCNLTRQAETIAPTGHTLGEPVEHPSTCTESGFERRTCQNANCDYFEDTITDPASHTWNEGVKTEATCLVDGYTTYTCTVCEATKVEKGEPATGEHHYTVLVDTIVGDCQKHTSYVYKCTTCKSTNIVVGPLGDHKFETQLSKQDATCTDDGLIVWQCSVCAKETKEEGIPALKHNFEGVEYKVKQEATCLADGLEAAKCTRCDEEITREIPRKDHTVAEGAEPVYKYIEVDTSKTVETFGDKNTKYYVCWICEECKQEVVKVEAAAAEEEPETPTYKWRLRDDSDIKEEWHAWVKTEGEGEKDPTCTEGGLYWYVCNDDNCSAIVDGKPLKVSIPQAALGHSFDGDYEMTVDPTCVDPATITFECTRCNVEFTMTLKTEDEGASYVPSFEDITIEGVEGGDPTTIEVTVEMFDKTSQAALLALIDEMKPLGHTWEITEEPVREYCGEVGQTTYTCSVCGETKTEESEPLPHAELAYYTEYGFCGMKTADHSVIKYGYCTRCGEIITSEKIDTNARHFVFNRTEIAKIVADWENMEPEEKLAARVEYAKVWNEIEKWYDLSNNRDHKFVEDLVPYLVTFGARDCREGYSVLCFDCFTSIYTVAATEHKFDETRSQEQVAPTCVEAGSTGYQYCTLCGLYIDMTSGEALRNEDGEYASEEEVIAATYIAPLGHKFTYGIVVPGDCTHGDRYGWYCEDCFKVDWSAEEEFNYEGIDTTKPETYKATEDGEENDLEKYLATLSEDELAEFGREIGYKAIADVLKKSVTEIVANAYLNGEEGDASHKPAGQVCEAVDFTVEDEKMIKKITENKENGLEEEGEEPLEFTVEDGYATYCTECGLLLEAQDHEVEIHKYIGVKNEDGKLVPGDRLEVDATTGKPVVYTEESIKELQEAYFKENGITDPKAEDHIYWYEDSDGSGFFTCFFKSDCIRNAETLEHRCGYEGVDHPHVDPVKAGNDLYKFKKNCQHGSICYVCGTEIDPKTAHDIQPIPVVTKDDDGNYVFPEDCGLTESQIEWLEYFYEKYDAAEESARNAIFPVNPYSTSGTCTTSSRIVKVCYGCLQAYFEGEEITWTKDTNYSEETKANTHTWETEDGETETEEKYFLVTGKDDFVEVTQSSDLTNKSNCLYGFAHFTVTTTTKTCTVCGEEEVTVKWNDTDVTNSDKSGADETKIKNAKAKLYEDGEKSSYSGTDYYKPLGKHYVVPVQNYNKSNYTAPTATSAAKLTFKCVVCNQQFTGITIDQVKDENSIYTAVADTELHKDVFGKSSDGKVTAYIFSFDEGVSASSITYVITVEGTTVYRAVEGADPEVKEKVGQLLDIEDTMTIEAWEEWCAEPENQDKLVDALLSGGDRVLGADLDLKEDDDVLVFDSKTNLDLHNNSLTFSNETNKTFLSAKGDVTIENGEILISAEGTATSTDYWGIIADEGGTLTLKNVKVITGNGSIGVCKNSTLIIENSIIYSTTSSAFMTNASGIYEPATITLKNSVFISSDANDQGNVGLILNNNSVLTAESCYFYGPVAGAWVRGGEATFTNCKFYTSDFGQSMPGGSSFNWNTGTSVGANAALVVGDNANAIRSYGNVKVTLKGTADFVVAYERKDNYETDENGFYKEKAQKGDTYGANTIHFNLDAKEMKDVITVDSDGKLVPEGVTTNAARQFVIATTKDGQKTVEFNYDNTVELFNNKGEGAFKLSVDNKTVLCDESKTHIGKIVINGKAFTEDGE